MARLRRKSGFSRRGAPGRGLRIVGQIAILMHRVVFALANVSGFSKHIEMWVRWGQAGVFVTCRPFLQIAHEHLIIKPVRDVLKASEAALGVLDLSCALLLKPARPRAQA